MMLLLHPREATLLRYAAGSARDTARRRVASHLADCDRCRGTVQSTRDLRVALASGGAVGAPDPLLQRILQSRMSGERVILPVEAPAPVVKFTPPVRRPGEVQLPRPIYLVAMGSAVAVALFSVAVDKWSEHTIDKANGYSQFGQRPEPLTLDQTIPKASPFIPGRLRPVALRYGMVNFNGAVPAGTQALPGMKLVRDPENTRNWIAITEPYRDDGVPDSMWINGETMEPLQWRRRSEYKGVASLWTYRLDGARIEVAREWRVNGLAPSPATLDSLIKRWGHDTTITFRQPKSAVVMGEMHMIAMMMAAPLSMGWRGSFQGMGVERSSLGFYGSQTLEIIGSHTLVTPAGVFDCWEANRRTRDGELTKYYRKSDGLFVGETVGAGTPYQLRTMLLSEE